MSKQQTVNEHYKQRGLATSGDAYNRDMFKAQQEDDNSHRSAPIHRDPEVRALYDNCEKTCCGCCSEPDNLEEGNSWCLIL